MTSKSNWDYCIELAKVFIGKSPYSLPLKSLINIMRVFALLIPSVNVVGGIMMYAEVPIIWKGVEYQITLGLTDNDQSVLSVLPLTIISIAGLLLSAIPTFIVARKAVKHADFVAAEEIRQTQDDARKRIFVIEHMGLEAVKTAPLMNSIKEKVPGRKVPISINQNAYSTAWGVHDFDRALEELTGFKVVFDRFTREVSSEDRTIVYGGIAPVPFTFLAGFTVDNHIGGSDLIVKDWQRNPGEWRTIEGTTTNHDLKVTVPDQAYTANEILVAVEISQAADFKAMEIIFKDIPLIKLTVGTGNIERNNHWSLAQQVAWCDQLDTVFRNYRGRCVNLVIAAQNSVVFNIGRQFEKRYPFEIRVFQHEQDNPIENRYPWAVNIFTGSDTGQKIYRIYRHSSAGEMK